ncbi:MAG: oligoendopeptidase F, partial [Kiloniellales bacterium]
MAKDANAAAGRDQDLGDLPAWDLGDLYPDPDCAALSDDLARCEIEAKAFRERYEGALAGLEGAALGAAISAYEAIQETLGRVTSYAQLVYAGDMSEATIGRFYQTMQERATDISAEILFFGLELNRLEEAALQDKMAAPELARYGPWLRDLRAFREHQLSDDLERLLHEKHVAGRAAWVRLFDQTMAALRFPLNGESLTSAEILNKLTDRDPALREAAAKSLGRVLGENLRTFALLTNTLAKDKEIEDGWRNFARPVSARNLENFVEDEVVEALIAAVRAAYPRLAHRYYGLKAKWFGVERLPYWDRNAPLPEDEDRLIPWDEARRTVLD